MASPPVIRPRNLSPSSIIHPHTPAVAKLQSLTRQFVRISIFDGRIFIGTFAGTDKLLNIILTNAEEYRVQSSGEPPYARYVNLVMIPWRHISSVEAPARWIQGDQTVSPGSSIYF